jgi:hypothetical protein
MTTPPPSRRGSGTFAAAAILALVAAACTGGAAAPAVGTPTTPPAVGTPAATPADPSAPAGSGSAPSVAPSVVSPSPSPDRGRPAPTVVPVTPEGGAPPEIVQAAVEDAAGRAGVDPTAVTVVRAEAVTWPNGALGCPKMGVMYTDVITPGYHLVVEAGGTTYDYRAGRKGGELRWCENPPGPG